ncbi:MAG: hypothetical protein HY829_10470 [Actinobacteria bacterium]|nr:hypothetical protein [Actinomycetota bacterium]
MTTFQDASLGFAPETVFGTFVPPIRHLEFVDEGLDLKKGIKQGQGLRVGGRVDRSGRRVVVTRDAGGPVKVEAASKGLGLWYQFLMGAGTSTLVSGTTYQQLFTLADIMPMISLQRGLPRVDGTVACHSFKGCTANSVEFSFPVADLLTLNADVDSRDVDLTQSYTSPTYAANPSLFSFAGASFSTGAITAPTATALASAPTSLGMIRGGSLKIDHKLKQDRFNAGGGGLKSRQPVGKRDITGKITVELDTTIDFVAAIIADTPLSLLLNWTAGALSTGLETIQLVLPEIKLDGLPKVNGTDLITHDVSFTVLDNLTAAQPVWLVVRTADSAL